MTGYTSGKTHSDTLPWKWIGNTSGAFSGRCSADVPQDAQHAYHGEYDPRPEYDNHNPILVAMRQELDCYASAVDAAADWLHSIERGDHDETISDDKLDHARRVLSKLAALTTTPNGVTD